MSVKNYVLKAITNNPEKYATDGGDLHLINAYFTAKRWKPLTREQHLAIANLIRGRITILKDNPLDMRKRFRPKEYPYQTDIYGVIGDAAIETYGADKGKEVEKVLGYFGRDTSRVSKSNRDIKKGIRGNITSHGIDLSKFVFTVCGKRETRKLFKTLLHSKEKSKGETV